MLQFHQAHHRVEYIKPHPHDAKGIFTDPSCPGEPVVKYSQLLCQILLGEGLHNVEPQRKSIITDKEVLKFFITCIFKNRVTVLWQSIWLWEMKGAIFNGLP